MITHLLRSIEKNTNKNCRNSFVLVYTVLCSPQCIFLLLFISQHFLLIYQIRQSDREFSTVHHVVEELSTQLSSCFLQVVLIEGRFSGVLPLCSRNEPVFLSWCTPVAMPETRECVVQGATNIFTSIHSMDFKITSIDTK